MALNDNFKGELIYIVPQGADASVISNRIPFPLRWIRYDTYECTVSTQDMDSTRVASGYLERNTLDHTATQIKFVVKPCNESVHRQMKKLMSDNYITSETRSGKSVTHKRNEKCLHLVYWDTEIDDYRDGYFYRPDTTSKIYMITKKARPQMANQPKEYDYEMLYEEEAFEFIEY